MGLLGWNFGPAGELQRHWRKPKGDWTELEASSECRERLCWRGQDELVTS